MGEMHVKDIGTSYTDSTTVTVYFIGALVWGTEPR